MKPQCGYLHADFNAPGWGNQIPYLKIQAQFTMGRSSWSGAHIQYTGEVYAIFLVRGNLKIMFSTLLKRNHNACINFYRLQLGHDYIIGPI